MTYGPMIEPEPSGDYWGRKCRVRLRRSLEAEPERERLEELAAEAQSEREEAAHFHDQEPGRWGDEASPARMRRERERDHEDDELANGWR